MKRRRNRGNGDPVPVPVEDGERADDGERVDDVLDDVLDDALEQDNPARLRAPWPNTVTLRDSSRHTRKDDHRIRTGEAHGPPVPSFENTPDGYAFDPATGQHVRQRVPDGFTAADTLGTLAAPIAAARGAYAAASARAAALRAMAAQKTRGAIA